jgi:hypothetical protein
VPGPHLRSAAHIVDGDLVALPRPSPEYHVVVTRHGVTSWAWEIYRNGKPLPVPVKDGNYKSSRVAELAGNVALREFLEALAREQDA